MRNDRQDVCTKSIISLLCAKQNGSLLYQRRFTMARYSHKRKKDQATGKWFWDTPPNRVRGLSLHDYILTRTKLDPVTGCWIWNGKISGHATITKHKELTENCSLGRASWICFFGPIVDKKIDVCHECDNGHCGNPMHLFLGTRKVNMGDCSDKGRICNGEKHPLAKLNAQMVVKMREDKERGLSYEKIAAKYGVTIAPCWSAINRRSWRHVP
jgi:hypothetical protein